MSDFVTLTCPSCGGKLEITDDVERFACAHCGAEHLVRRGGGMVALQPMIDSLADVENGVDRLASEMAIVRLQQEIADIDQRIDKMDAEHDRQQTLLQIYVRQTTPEPPQHLEHFANNPLQNLLLTAIIGLPVVLIVVSILALAISPGLGAFTFFCVSPLVLLWYVFNIFQGGPYRDRERHYAVRRAHSANETQRMAYLTERSRLLTEREEKQQQLAKHRKIVSE
jgi:hypothetical protein